MKYSVVIPCYNNSLTIKRAILSCLQQSIPPESIWVVDDASTDDSVATILSIDSPLLKLIRFSENKGPAAARNAGWAMVDSEWLAFLDADDIWHKDKVSVISQLDLDEVSVLTHDYSYVAQPLNNFTGALLSYNIPFTRFLVRNQAVTPSLLVRSKVTLRFDETMRYCEDYDLLIRLSYLESVNYINLPLVILSRKLKSKGGLSDNHLKMRLGEMKAYFKLIYLSPFFVFIVPFLLIWSICKHIKVKIISI